MSRSGKDAKNPVVLENAISINPLNWKRDNTYAPASENLGDRIPICDGDNFLMASDFQVHRPGLADAQLDVERGVVVCTAFADQYVKPLAPGMEPPFGPASLHNMDYPAYWENIRGNVQARIRAYMEKCD